ncbi:MAG: BlaI/MecI/CopY family transcriptional regulator [Bacillota bacterium]|nr:BlaI/MecI/CopY family transcriptional regulator [Bacillota bacterium]
MDRDINLSHADYRLLSLVWDAEPVASPELCKLAEAQLGWKRTTTYTVLRRLCDKGFAQSERTIVTSLWSREQVRHIESRQVLERSFDGSLPQFIAAFLGNEKINNDEAEQLKRLIDQYREGK